MFDLMSVVHPTEVQRRCDGAGLSFLNVKHYLNVRVEEGPNVFKNTRVGPKEVV